MDPCAGARRARRLRGPGARRAPRHLNTTGLRPSRQEPARRPRRHAAARPPTHPALARGAAGGEGAVPAPSRGAPAAAPLAGPRKATKKAMPPHARIAGLGGVCAGHAPRARTSKLRTATPGPETARGRAAAKGRLGPRAHAPRASTLASVSSRPETLAHAPTPGPAGAAARAARAAAHPAAYLPRLGGGAQRCRARAISLAQPALALRRHMVGSVCAVLPRAWAWARPRRPTHLCMPGRASRARKSLWSRSALCITWALRSAAGRAPRARWARPRQPPARPLAAPVGAVCSAPLSWRLLCMSPPAQSPNRQMHPLCFGPCPARRHRCPRPHPAP